MSAYIVDKNHITYLIAAAMSRNISAHGSPLHWYHNGVWFELPPGNYDRAADMSNQQRDNLKAALARTVKHAMTITDVARLGGQTKSAKRAAASAKNGAKGGRPRKIKAPVILVVPTEPK